ncbi:hypothetical protein KQX54_002661 [Cotesia glomerata]|uniref:Uncharacterized protein n=1 Tax=Cotesia glomerata TaxID=32391 RepID=A0AAV7ISW5_COTGL|nr:hypothetical protein KQX54_002661 [Cotesia glomerata]
METFSREKMPSPPTPPLPEILSQKISNGTTSSTGNMTARIFSLGNHSSNFSLIKSTQIISRVENRRSLMNSELNYEWRQLEREIWGICWSLGARESSQYSTVTMVTPLQVVPIAGRTRKVCAICDPTRLRASQHSMNPHLSDPPIVLDPTLYYYNPTLRCVYICTDLHYYPN